MRQKNRLSDSVWTAFTESLRFIVVPLVLLDLVTKNYPLLTTPFMDRIGEYVLFFGGMIVASSTLEAMNKQGTFKRMLFGLSALAFICMWLFVIFGGGIAEFTYGPYHVRFDMTLIVYIMLVGICFKGFLIMDTYSVFKGKLAQEAEAKRLEKEEDRKEAIRAKQAARLRGSGPGLSSYSKVAFEVTHDDSVGYEPPPPPPPPAPVTKPAGTSAARTMRTVKFKVCPICGEKAVASESICRNCGAWFAKESFRFEKDSSRNP
jgi:predicted RNA-binding Zn-ribbon protein involved in translation (DUF1610 family)